MDFFEFREQLDKQLDEISTAMARRYKDKADDQAFRASADGDYAKSDKRSAGAQRAQDKIRGKAKVPTKSRGSWTRKEKE